MKFAVRRSVALLFASSAFLFLSAAFGADDSPPAVPSAGGPGIIDWKDAHKFIDEEVVVQGWIVQARSIGQITFLNFDRERTVTAIVRQRNYKNFSKPPEEMYAGKFVRILGTVTEYRGKPQIEVTQPGQVTVFEKEEPIPADRVAVPRPPVKKREFTGSVRIACYNVENLFDAHDDPYTKDESTDPKSEAQLSKLAATIRALDADVIALEEVEHRGVLEAFVKRYIGDLGYRNVVLIEGNDARGIDCALITWLPVGPVTSHRHVEFSDGSGGKMTFRRDLLQVRLEPPAAPSFDVFVVHLKCCGGDDDIRIRNAEAVAVRKILDDQLKSDPGSRFVICGDFNDRWDSQTIKLIRGSGEGMLKDFLSDLPEGALTYNKPPHLSMIDFILASPAMARHYVAKSYRIIDGETAKAASDHYPVRADFNLKGRSGDE
ncbi:MAG: endonuclease/exonuclease/phosphatase family protein [Phycisphaerae bacterium]|nr:endonuclease/exonuclease/phosphatase family protein [Phycisphaerae bacterium]